MTVEYTTENSALVDSGFHFAPFFHYNAMQVAIELVKTRGGDAHVTQLLVDLESSTPANGNVIRIPGEESQRRKAEILSSSILSLEEPTYPFLCS